MRTKNFTFEKQIKENVNLHLSLIKMSNEVEKSIKLISKKIKNGGKILFCGKKLFRYRRLLKEIL